MDPRSATDVVQRDSNRKRRRPLLETVLDIATTGGPGAPARLREAGLTARRCRRLLQNLPLDTRSFVVQFGGRERAEALDVLRSFVRGHTQVDDRVVGYVGLIQLTIALIDEFDRRRGTSPDLGAAPAADLAAVAELVELPSVRRAVEAVYSPALDERQPSDGGRDIEVRVHERRVTWEQVDFASLTLHRIGTTSFILRGTAGAGLPGVPDQQVALKCLLLPYSSVPAIADATADYVERFRGAAPDGRPSSVNSVHFPAVRASSETWVVMDFVAGPTLEDELDHRLGHVRASRILEPSLRVDLLQELGTPLFAALDDIRQRGWTHLDLAPSNIILTGRPGDRTAVFIDFGRNFLYSRAIGALEGREARFVAPEVKDDAPDNDALADVYSLGWLLVAISGSDPGTARTVPDTFYARTPALARFLEDLIDVDQSRRLVLYGDVQTAAGNSATWSYAVLREEFELELHAVASADRLGLSPTDRHWVRGLLAMLGPNSRSPGRQRRLLAERRKQERRLQRERREEERHEQEHRLLPNSWIRMLLRRNRSDIRFAGGLLGWSALCATAWAVTVLVITTQIVRDLGIDPTPVPFQVLQKLGDWAHWQWLADSAHLLSGELGRLLGPGSHANLPARAVSLTFALVNVKHYQNIFAGVTPLPGHRLLPRPQRLHAYTAEFLIRLFSFWWIAVDLAPNFGHARIWPLCVPIGLSMQLVLIVTVSSFAGLAIRRAQRHGLSTVAPAGHKITGLSMFGRWAPSMLVFLLVCWPAALLIYSGRLHDEVMYSVILSVGNLGIFYVVKCSLDAHDIRGGLARAFLASERLATLQSLDKAQ